MSKVASLAICRWGDFFYFTALRRVYLFLLLLHSLSGILHAQSHAHTDWALVNVSVCNTRSDAAYTSGQESQALLGMPLKVLKRHREWTQVRTPEDYKHWILSSCLKRVTAEELSAWNRSEQVVVTSLQGFVYEKPSRRSQVVSDVVAGNRLKLLGKRARYYRVAYPDGRIGYIPRSIAKPLDRWRAHLKYDAESILQTAHAHMGIPYMWGGTSAKGVDCSGFIRAALFMHDIIIPRNADEQAQTGERIEIAPDFSNLQPGDLLFFGSRATAERPASVIHVGFYIGNKRFIHSSGCVHVGSFDEADPLFDRYERNRLLFASRILPYINKQEHLFTTDQSPYYQ